MGIVADHSKCATCQYCVVFCSCGAVTVIRILLTFPSHATWTKKVRSDVWRQAETGTAILTSTDLDYPSIFDHILIDACQVISPSRPAP